MKVNEPVEYELQRCLTEWNRQEGTVHTTKDVVLVVKQSMNCTRLDELLITDFSKTPIELKMRVCETLVVPQQQLLRILNGENVADTRQFEPEDMSSSSAEGAPGPRGFFARLCGRRNKNKKRNYQTRI